MKNKLDMIIGALLLICLSTPATATVHSFSLNGGYTLTINSDTNEGSFVGGPVSNSVSVTFTSEAFSNFQGGLTPPSGKYILQTLEGKRIVDGADYYPLATAHDYQVVFDGTRGVNFWAVWRSATDTTHGDFHLVIDHYTFAEPDPNVTDVPEPGLLGLLTLGVGGLLFGRRRRRPDMKEISAIS